MAKETYEEVIETNEDDVIQVEVEETDEEQEEEQPSEEELNMLKQNVDETKVDTTKKENSAKNNGAPYYIKINYTANCVTIYKKDDSGEYTIPVKAMVCSSGVATPRSGVYKIGPRYRWRALFGGVYGQYSVKITGNILFHSVPYLNQSTDSLEYWEYDKLGTSASAGCIRLSVADAIWIYNNCGNGTYAEFYSSPDPGPLGKPSARKISSNEVCRNWDPTDPEAGNPWNSFVAQTVQPKPEVKQETQNNKTEVKEESKKEENNLNQNPTNEVNNEESSNNTDNNKVNNTNNNTAENNSSDEEIKNEENKED